MIGIQIVAAVSHRSSQEVMQRNCCGYLAAVEAFKQAVPEEFARQELPALQKQCRG